MLENLIIRTCREADESAFVRLNLEFMQEVSASSPYWSGLNKPSPAEMGRVFAEAIAMPEHIQIFIAELDGEIVGYANTWTVYSIWSGGKALTVDDLYVAFPYRARGVGKRLMEYLMRYAGEEGYKRIQLHAEPGNANALALYEKLAFQAEGMVFCMKLL